MLKTILIVLFVTIVGLVVFSATEAVSEGITTSTSYVATSYSSTDMLTITLSGQVENPGTYYIDVGTTLSDAISKAGGTTSNADSRAYNGDYELSDGLSFYIAPLRDVNDACSLEEISKVNINTADKSELLSIPGFGDAISTNLISYRESTATFKRLEDIKNVSGIGDATFSKSKDYMILKEA